MKTALTESQRERVLNALVMSKLNTDHAYKHAEDAESQAEREAEIERECERLIDAQCYVIHVAY